MVVHDDEISCECRRSSTVTLQRSPPERVSISGLFSNGACFLMIDMWVGKRDRLYSSRKSPRERPRTFLTEHSWEPNTTRLMELFQQLTIIELRARLTPWRSWPSRRSTRSFRIRRLTSSWSTRSLLRLEVLRSSKPSSSTKRLASLTKEKHSIGYSHRGQQTIQFSESTCEDALLSPFE